MYIWPVIGVINLLMTSRGPPSNGKSTMLTVISHGYIRLPNGYFPANIHPNSPIPFQQNKNLDKLYT